jgi:hypothetical protein
MGRSMVRHHLQQQHIFMVRAVPASIKNHPSAALA